MKKTIKAKIMKVTNTRIGNEEKATIEVDKILPVYDIFRSGTRNIIIEIDEPILDETEKRYLSAVIKPFINEIEYIAKRVSYSSGYYIDIGMKNDDSLLFPYFKDKRMYKSMVTEKEYTLEELGL